MSVGLRSGLYDGNIPPWQSGRYYFVPNTGSTSTSATFGVGTLRAVPFYVPSSITLTRIGAEITTIGDAGSKVRLGIYADDGTGRPGALVVDAGQIAGDSATVQELTISASLSAGWYWSASVVQSVTVTQPTIRAITTAFDSPTDVGTTTPAAASSSVGWAQSSVTGALPPTFTPGALSGMGARVFVKVQ